MIARLFRTTIFFLERDKTVEAALITLGLAIAAVAALLELFATPNILLKLFYLALTALLPIILYRALIIAFLAYFDIFIQRWPERTLELKSNLELARARITRVFVEKKLPTFSTGAYSLFALGIERRFLNFITTKFKLKAPHTLFCKDPFIVVRLWELPLTPGGTPLTKASIACENTIQAKTLAKAIETLVRY